jgi:hypothetical protein
MKVINSIRVETQNLDQLKALDCVERITGQDGTEPLTVRLKECATLGRQTATKHQYLCQFESGKWQVFGQIAEACLHYNPYC